jgi:hypothetical protein
LVFKGDGGFYPMQRLTFEDLPADAELVEPDVYIISVPAVHFPWDSDDEKSATWDKTPASLRKAASKLLAT